MTPINNRSELPLSRDGRTVHEVIETAAREAGHILEIGRGQTLNITEKSPANPVTNLDHASEARIKTLLTDAYPDFGFLGEESGETRSTSDWQWIVDPLDGTRNLIRGLPMFCVTIGLTRNGQPVAGATYDPTHNELFVTSNDGPPTLNGQPIKTASATRLEDCIIGIDFGKSSGVYRETYEVIGKLMPRFQSIRMFGSIAIGLAYVAAGRLDIYFNLKSSPWDIAGGLALARQSGAAITNIDGTQTNMPTNGLIAANPEIIAQFVETTR
ncbi:MAG: inositol monophosphatase [Chloroflexi bacterium]|nr:inositol monophosphatase [Chloroflexota bacterium]